MNKPRILRFVKNLIFPPHCVFCDRIIEPNAERDVCGECSKELKLCSASVCCHKCGKPIISFAKEPVCYFCLSKKPKYYDRIASVFEYDGYVRDSILRYKNSGMAKYAKTYGECMSARLFEEYGGIEFDFICGVPSHTNKKRQYGFDQVELLCSEISKNTEIPYIAGVLKKLRKTKKQRSLKYEERQKNMKDSVGTARPELVSGKVVLLIDDVCTTRATLKECSRALKMSGAKRVYALTLATTTGC